CAGIGPHLSRHDRHDRRLSGDALRLCRRELGEASSPALVRGSVIRSRPPEIRRSERGAAGSCGGAHSAAAHTARVSGTAEEERAMTTLRALIAALLVVGVFGWAVAKLPPP